MNKDHFKIVVSNIFEVKADVLAFSANPHPMTTVGSLDTAVYFLAGRDDLLKERKKIGVLDYGNLFVSKSFGLSDRFKWLFHIVTPMYMSDSYGEIELLEEAYKTCLKKADHLNAHSIVFPLMGTGILGFSNAEAFDIAKRAINEIAPSLNPMRIMIAVENNEQLEIERFSDFTQEYVHDMMKKMRDEQKFISEEDEADTLERGMEIALHWDFVRKKIAENKKDERISRDIAKEKKQYLDSNPNKTEKDFALEKISKVINDWINGTKDDYSGERYERTLRSAAELANEIGASPSTVSKLTNCKGSVPSRKMLISLAIGMKLNRDDRVRFILYANEDLRYPHDQKEMDIEQILTDSKSCPKFDAVNKMLFERTGKTIRKSSQDTDKPSKRTGKEK